MRRDLLKLMGCTHIEADYIGGLRCSTAPEGTWVAHGFHGPIVDVIDDSAGFFSTHRLALHYPAQCGLAVDQAIPRTAIHVASPLMHVCIGKVVVISAWMC
ncbi:hypothetical protein FA143_29500 [Pseudomonas aeruginosa]|uniref:Uncharacterized protein n=2 Tax=Pseudomonas aeruginosa TaxID=287 RepID=Q7WY47_PSEAI|nr:hypothetical protein RL010 [Pseudomonas aeruginosa PA14]ABJ13914.1 hypothetical protein PA14_60060 [Pseudomonas aeruginosa UCBPP-PA14]ARH13574.1 hypothetical protein HW04_30305 [Pseudomonas aeruginosa]EKA40428.1 hypothetical protein PACI27_4996 [Pseudomonas aeruginosa CI27]MCO1821018.1 hypothetical protein [Pseudomonas aeruginosa]